jgi:pyruvate/2-oxoglutarate dehydrogenase complex dihydrolipoamide acyltransferase (E2) component
VSAATKTPRITARAGKETVLAAPAAVELARQAAEELARPGEVGEHLGMVVEGERLVTHVFEARVAGYRGWHWAVTVARPPRGRVATVCEAGLLPGDGAILAPEWVPWSDRLRPGDVGPTDALPFLPDDPRLEQGYEATGDEDADRLAIFELGLGRPRVLSREGRGQALTRWYDGDHGPSAASAKAAKAPCSTCGFLMKLAGSPRTVFGVCANEWSPDDGRVVSMDHGCGAHSETDAPHPVSLWNPSEPVIDERDLEVLATHPVAPEVVESVDEVPAEPEAETDQPLVAEPASEPVDAAAEPAEAQGPAASADLPAELAAEDADEAAADTVPEFDAVRGAEQAAAPDETAEQAENAERPEEQQPGQA